MPAALSNAEMQRLKFFALFVVATATQAGGCATECEEHGYDAGEHFVVTVLGPEVVTVPSSGCYFNEGDTFELVAGEWDEGPVCGSGAVGLPPFRSDVLSECSQARRGQLGMDCRAGAAAPLAQCPETLEFYTYPPIERDDRVRDDMKLDFAWNNQGCQRCAGTLKIRVQAVDRPQ